MPAAITNGEAAPSVRGKINTAFFELAAALSAIDGKAAAFHGHSAANISDFNEAVDDRVAALLAPGANVSLSYDDVTGQLTISSTGGGGGGSAEIGVLLTDSAVLTWPGAANNYYVMNSASAETLQLPVGPIDLGSKIVGLNIGAGALTFTVGGGDPAIQADAMLPASVSQFSPFELRRSPTGWVRIA